MHPVIFALLAAFLPSSSASVTTYTPLLFSPTGAPAALPTTGPLGTFQAFSPVTVPAPAPLGAPITAFIQLTAAPPAGLSIPHSADYLGLSIELSIADTLLGEDGDHIPPAFLNLMSNLQQRSGTTVARVGGNTQDGATLFEGKLPNGKSILKFEDPDLATGTTKSPPLDWSTNLLYSMANISNLINMKWYTGIPFNDTTNFTRALDTAEWSQRILGDNLIGMQLGNEPDLYSKNGRRQGDYEAPQYVPDWAAALAKLQQDSNIPDKYKNMFLAPSTCCQWGLNEVFATGFLGSYSNSLSAVSIQYYPQSSCPTVAQVPPDQTMNNMMSHTQTVNYVNSQNVAGFSAQTMAVGKPLVMFETNTASCGGFLGISDAFVSGLWGIDYTLQLAFQNVSTTLIHVGGRNATYNPFTPPPKTGLAGLGWTVGPMYYSMLIVAEILGRSGNAQLLDLGNPNVNLLQNADTTPVYAVYEQGNLVRLAIFNFNNDPTGGYDYQASFAIGGTGVGQANGTPAQVQVKYFSASSLVQKGNLTWAGQTFGGTLQSDGRPIGDESVQTITCNTGTNTCTVPVKAPGFALVFLTSSALSESDPHGTQTFATTATDVIRNTATIDQAVLATSNGYGGTSNHQVGSTSPNSTSDAQRTRSVMAVVAGLVGIVSFLWVAVVGRW